MAEDSAKPSSIPDEMTEEMKSKIKNGKNRPNQIEDENEDPMKVLEGEDAIQFLQFAKTSKYEKSKLNYIKDRKVIGDTHRFTLKIKRNE